jgi:hypothetical protein
MTHNSVLCMYIWRSAGKFCSIHQRGRSLRQQGINVLIYRVSQEEELVSFEMKVSVILTVYAHVSYSGICSQDEQPPPSDTNYGRIYFDGGILRRAFHWVKYTNSVT